MSPRRLLITSALPYANGPIHLGHLVEYLQTDIWVRFQRLRGHRAIYVCADDTHGTAIMIRARQENRSEEELIVEMQAAHLRDFAGFQIQFDNYGSTNSQENRKLCARVWQSLRAADLVAEKNVQQLFDVQQGTFLADRFVRGTCPHCSAVDQPGDNCSNCGAAYAPRDLHDPVSVLSGTTPELRSAKHLFIELEQLHDFLTQWSQHSGCLQPEVANYLKGHFLGDPASPEGRKVLRDWDISRPAPYFGFEIPDSPGNYWYVWFDAPIGYLASTQQWATAQGEDLDDWWKSEETEIHHFIGKDITYFHTLFWPGMLKVAGYQLPTKVHIHGFLTVGGAKMSKSKGTFVKAETYLRHLDPSYLRYYYAAKLGPRLDDIDLSLAEFVQKVNSDLVGKVVNLASRTAKFVHRMGLSPAYPEDGGLFAAASEAGDAIADAYERCDYNRAMRLIMELADHANPYVESHEPWKLAKDPQRQSQLQDVCTVALNLFRQLAIYLAPVLPQLAEQTAELLKTPIGGWHDARTPLTGTEVAKFKHMLKRINPQDVENMIEESREPETLAETTQSTNPTTLGDGEPDGERGTDSGSPLESEPLCEQISFDEFAKVDFRVARVLAAEDVPDAKKLLRLTLGIGGSHRRTVLAGIKQAYKPEELVGRLLVMVANLAPRKMKFGLSEGMILASGPGAEDVFLLSPDDGALPGERVH